MKIGVFDSGIGGLSVAKAIEHVFPDAQVLFRKDSSGHFPYATKTPDELYGYVVPVLQSLVDEGCEVLVIACNTVSTTLIQRLREQFTTPLVAVEPMVKPAAMASKRGAIAVCATPTTLASERYVELKRLHAQHVTVIEPDCADWSELIEHNKMNENILREQLQPALAAGVDVVVLGCTHYHWVESEVRSIMGPDVQVMQPEIAVIEQLTRVSALLR